MAQAKHLGRLLHSVFLSEPVPSIPTRYHDPPVSARRHCPTIRLRTFQSNGSRRSQIDSAPESITINHVTDTGKLSLLQPPPSIDFFISTTTLSPPILNVSSAEQPITPPEIPTKCVLNPASYVAASFSQFFRRSFWLTAVLFVVLCST